MKIPAAAVTIWWSLTLCYGQGVITTIAGTGSSSATGDGGPATSATFHPDGLAMDNAGNFYIADQNNNRIRKVDANGVITTFAGNGGTQFSGDGGIATSSTVYIAGNHNELAVDAAGNLYMADDGHHRIRKVDRNGIITTVAGSGSQGFSGDGGSAKNAQLYRPMGIAVDAAGNLYIADTFNRRVRKVDASSGNITTVAGTGEFGTSGDGGLATLATMESPVDVTVDAQGNIYFADLDGAIVRKINSAGIITRVAGNATTGFSGDGGLATSAALGTAQSVTLDRDGNIYISDFSNRRVRKVDTNGVITTIAGGGGVSSGPADGGPPTSANVSPNAIVFDSAGNYYIADYGQNRIRKVTVGARVPGLSATASSIYFSYAPAGGNVPNGQIVNVFTTGSVPLAFTLNPTTSAGGDWLKVTPANGGNTSTLLTVSTNVIPPIGTYQGNIALKPAAQDLPTVNIPVTLAVVSSVPTRPVITPNGVVNGASFKPGVVPNSLATIQGTNLASTTDTWNNSLASGLLPTSLDGVTVLFNGRPAYVAYISPTQINLIVPDVAASGNTPVVLTNNGTSPTGLFTIPTSIYGPAFFLWPGNQIVATRTDYTYAVNAGTFPTLTTVAARPGDVLILWGTGFGPTTPPVPTGVPVPGDKTYSTSTAPTITIDNISATVYGAALASGFAGLYQVAIQVPDSIPDGDWPIIARIGNVSSPTGVVLTVKR